ncbi:hypothetical protein LGQ03_00080 [Loktanella sp. TSTF-M6]|uniref:Yip1 domain-containing protein n=1 Tax=Loktanella gaetbuli TaxID=2881335 RepID=A0ABS8BPZ4_9RHOB|nr:hypothetical protein [Loktanella gaetbuli]MCB5197626.1 hypothetical protein [Loktanella gaetbuli]
MEISPWMKRLEEAGSTILIALGIGAVCIYSAKLHLLSNSSDFDPVSFILGWIGLASAAIIHIALICIGYLRLSIAAQALGSGGHKLIGWIAYWATPVAVLAVEFQMFGLFIEALS